MNTRHDSVEKQCYFEYLVKKYLFPSLPIIWNKKYCGGPDYEQHSLDYTENRNCQLERLYLFR